MESWSHGVMEYNNWNGIWVRFTLFLVETKREEENQIYKVETIQASFHF